MDNLAPAVRMLQKRIPNVASPRILRWLILLGGYQFTVEHRSAAKHRNCDALSRCPDSRPVCDQTESEFEKEIVRSIYFLSPGPLADTQMTLPEELAPAEVARATAADAVLQKVLHWVRYGWPKRCPGEKFAPYFRKRAGLSIIRDCLMFGTRVVLPDSFIPIVRQMFIGLHVGVEKCQFVLLVPDAPECHSGRRRKLRGVSTNTAESSPRCRGVLAAGGAVGTFARRLWNVGRS